MNKSNLYKKILWVSTTLISITGLALITVYYWLGVQFGKSAAETVIFIEKTKNEWRTSDINLLDTLRKDYIRIIHHSDSMRMEDSSSKVFIHYLESLELSNSKDSDSLH